MKTELFDFILPAELIAQTPAAKRSESRLLVHNRATGAVEHRRFADIVEYFAPGDLLILNSSRVIPARIFTLAYDGRSGGSEVLFIKSLGQGSFEAMVRPGKKFKPGRRHLLPGDCLIEVVGVLDSGLRVLRTCDGRDPVPVFREHGEMPLPPYITSRESTPDRYQTVYSNEEGSVAAPTAGLHFDDQVFSALRAKKVNIAEIILHVGLGTFKPIETETLDEHQMHEEIFFISPETADLFAKTRSEGGRVWGCGTTSIRTLESAIDAQGKLKTGWQSTACFIRPGYKFRAVDCFITNFHLPKSTLIVLVAAFCGRERVLSLYEEAVSKKYRFYSFGDSMVII
ncbi:MAG: tRNA preQ1(34) S-adenosylmethionine ribosyltransferase-isomerase QueA [Candidatus Riflebacteria bacterium]|nr:tRNA preQ1(34) S-adenosylmethionine ribosyltransferase-isomerase QueA [Candidatus Riflebacteria bacterium]